MSSLRAAVAFALVALSACAGCSSTIHVAQQRRADVAREESPDTLADRGRAFAELGDLTRAEQYLASALAHGADPRRILPLLLRVCVREGRYRSAAFHADEYVRTHPNDARIHAVAGIIHEELSDHALARDLLERAVALDPASADAHIELAHVLDAIGEPIEADVQRREFLRLAPSDPRVEEVRGRLLQRVPR